MEYPQANLLPKQEAHSAEFTIREDQLLDIPPKLKWRVGGELDGKGFLLPSSYDWIIVRDNSGYLTLVPLKK